MHKEPDNQWVDISPVQIVERKENSQLRVVVTCLNGDTSKPYLSFREFNRYLTKKGKLEGKTIEDCIYLPSGMRGCSIPLEKGTDFVSACVQAIADAEEYLANN